jgi:hypothetical protein
MVLTTPKQIKNADLPVPRRAEGQALRQQAAVSVSGYFYAVNLGCPAAIPPRRQGPALHL